VGDAGRKETVDNLVGIAEIAELAGSSRQAITNLRTRDDSFPLPVADLRSGPVYREADIQAYLLRRGGALPPAEPAEAVDCAPAKFDPLTPLNLARSVERAVLDQPEMPLPPDGTFIGGGVYCLYYSGSYEPYSSLAGGPSRTPIYVGSATQRAGRMAGALFQSDRPILLNRLREHAHTLKETEDLQLEDFSCRFLITDDLWVQSAATLLIYHFRPLWNIVVDGFGLHNPGAGRSLSKRSSWDELHPGRSWATRLASSPQSRGEILKAVEEYMREIPAPHLSSVPQQAWYL
jgi:hypothetical protein